MEKFCSIIDDFEKTCKIFSHRPALLCHEDSRSYQELYDKINLWSLAIEDKNKNANRVLIFLDKGIAYVETIYSILSLGMTYIPIDASQPIERVRLIIEQSDPDLIITTASRKNILESDTVSVPMLTVESFEDNYLQEMVVENDRTFHRSNKDDIAIILFTSGSTGIPKGVQISHENLSFFIRWAKKELALTENDVLSNHAAFAFDLSTFDIFAAGIVGASTWIVTVEEQRDVATLINSIHERQISVWYSVPSVLSMMVYSGCFTFENNHSLRHVIFAGESYGIKALKELKTCLASSCSLYNWYGPTETNVCFSYRVTDQCIKNNTNVPIGLPLPGLENSLVQHTDLIDSIEDDTGELIVHGVCVTPGYVNVSDSAITLNHKSRSHATGDVIYKENDLYYFHSRIDDMVKINGNRVELGEIESCLDDIPAVKEAVVVHAEGGFQHKLIAFIVLDDNEGKLNTLTVKQHVSQHLPKYMIPNSVKIIKLFPYNTNGKVDRKDLQKRCLEGAHG